MSPPKPLIKCSAPGKIILHGEHSVVYGKLAIAASLDLRTNVTLDERSNNKLEVNFIDLKYRKHFNLSDIKRFNGSFDSETYLNPDTINFDQFIEEIKGTLNLSPDNLAENKFSSLIALLFLYYGIVYSSISEKEALYVTVKTDLSLGSGTGSSASLMVALSAAFIQYLVTKNPEIKEKFEINDCKHFNGKQLNLISRWAFQAERIIHGNPSGIDNTICTYGSLVSFRKGRAPITVKCNREIRGVIVDTKVPKNTAVQVEKVVQLRQKFPRIVQNILDALENVCNEALELLIQLGDVDGSGGDSQESQDNVLYQDLGALCSINHNLLQSLGVSHPSLDKAVELMSTYGLKGKMTGAGGGGYAIALIPPCINAQQVEELCAKLEPQGFKGTIIKLGSTGVRFDL